MVTEFLRRVSGRAEKTIPASGQKAKSGLKNLERIPARPPAASLHRNDSVTRIVNQRFMKQREEVSRAQKEEKESNQSSSVRHSSSTGTAEVSGTNNTPNCIRFILGFYMALMSNKTYCCYMDYNSRNKRSGCSHRIQDRDTWVLFVIIE